MQHERAMQRLVSLVFFLLWLAQSPAFGAEQALTVDELLSNANQYTGKSVLVSAVAVIKFENLGLCSTRAKSKTQSKAQGKNSSCVWLEIDSGPYESAVDQRRYKKAWDYWSKFNGRRVNVRGVFTSGKSGHFGMWPGSIEQVVWVRAL